MHGIGRNFEMTNNFYSMYFQKIFKKIISTSQFYQLYTNLLTSLQQNCSKIFIRIE